MVLSSGTSGAPKAIKMTSRMIINNCICAAAKGALVYNSSDVSVLAQPLSHAGGHNLWFLDVIYSGANFVVVDQPDPVGLLEITQKFKLTHLIAVPSVINFLAKYEHLESFDLSSLKYILTGGTTPNFESVDKVVKRSGNSSVVVKNIYGITEAGAIVFCTNNYIESKLESIGVSLPGFLFKLVEVDDPSKVISVPDRPGELLLKHPVPYLLYFNAPEQTEQSLTSDGFFKTGDMATFDQNFNLYIISRIKDVVKFRGFSVSPGELEDVLMESSLVLDCSVVAEPHAVHVEIPVAFVVPSESGKVISKELIEKTLIDFVASSVAEHKRIWKVYVLDEIPRNTNKKVLKRVLRDGLMEEMKRPTYMHITRTNSG